MRIGVLAVQGAFAEHRNMLSILGVESIELRQKAHMHKSLDGLILPGGESSVMGKLLHELAMFAPLQEAILQRLPVFGTCAGMILLAKKLSNDTRCHLATMDIEVTRNAYGRQLASFCTTAQFAGEPIPMSFIRAPYVSNILDNSKHIEILAEVDQKIVAVKQGTQLVTAFHPEVTKNTYVHAFFLQMIKQKSMQQ